MKKASLRSTLLVRTSILLFHKLDLSARAWTAPLHPSPTSQSRVGKLLVSFSDLYLSDDEDEEEGPISIDWDTPQADYSSDWVQSELTLLQAPTEPSPDLSAELVAQTVCRSLQWVDKPTENAGLKRCFEFFTFECRKAVTARQGGQTVDAFCQHGLLSPALQPFMGARRIDLGLQEATYTPAHPPLRGALVSIPVTIHGADVLSLQHPSGMERNGVGQPPVTNMVLRLEEQRRPPYQGCWLVREVMDVRYAFAGDMGNAHVGG